VVAYRLAVADLHDQAVEVDDRVDGLQRPGLPRLGVLEHAVGDLGDQVRRDFGTVDLGQMALDLADRQAARVERDHLLVEADPARLALADDLGLEGSLAVPRRADPDRALVGQHGLRGLAVAGVARPARGRLTRRIAQVLGQLGLQRTLDQPPRELAEQPVRARDLLGPPGAGEQLVDQLIRESRPLEQPAARQSRQRRGPIRRPRRRRLAVG
jgi:hypothetical protein